MIETGDEALVSCGIMESLIRVINWFDDDGQDHITVRTLQICILLNLISIVCQFTLFSLPLQIMYCS